jgi:hypothetical protein
MGATITRLDFQRVGYGGSLPFLIGGVGESYKMTLEFDIAYSFSSSLNNPVQWNNSAFEILGSTWQEAGFNVGDTVTIGFQNSSGTFDFSGTTILQFVDGNRAIPEDFAIDILNATISPDNIYPNGQDKGVFVISANKPPQGVGLKFNLINNELNQSIFSIISDDLQPQYLYSDVPSLNVGDSVNMPFFGYRSGGQVYETTLTRLSDPLDPFGLKRKYRLETKFANWGFFEPQNEDGTPAWFELEKCLKPYVQLEVIAQNGNPNSAQVLTSETITANTGYFDENNNGGVSEYSVKSIDFSILGNPVSGIDYVAETDVRVVFNAFTQNPLSSFYSYGMFYVNRSAEEMSEKPNQVDSQILLSNGGWGKIFQNPNLSDPTFTGAANVDGARLQVGNIVFTPNPSANELIFECTVRPNSEAAQYFEDKEEGDREVILYVSIGNHFLNAQTDTRVPVIAYRGQLERQPVIAGEYDDVDFTGFYQHPDEPADVVNPSEIDTFKEDDILWKVDFLLEKGANVQSLTVQTEVNNLYALERKIVLTDGYPTLPDGTIEIDYTAFRSYSMPNQIQNRRKITIKRNTALDTSTKAGYTLEYGLLSRWEYWISNDFDTTNLFFDSSLPNNGQSNDWILYAPLNVALYIEIDGLSYYVRGDVLINDYDSSATVTSVHNLYLENGTTPAGALLDGNTHVIEAVHTLSSGTWDVSNAWGWITIENKEGQKYARISTKWDWSTIDKPFRPLSGETGAQLTFPAPNIAVVKAFIVTDELDGFGQFDITSRIEGFAVNPPCAKLKEDGTYKVKEDTELKRKESLGCDAFN